MHDNTPTDRERYLVRLQLTQQIKHQYKMRLIIFLSSMLFLSSCYDNSRRHYYELNEGDIAELDSCEYIINDSRAGKTLTHKGNCKYCEKRMEKKIRKLLDEVFLMQE